MNAVVREDENSVAVPIFVISSSISNKEYLAINLVAFWGKRLVFVIGTEYEEIKLNFSSRELLNQKFAIFAFIDASKISIVCHFRE